MPFVEGESLADRIRRETQLPVDEALHITREVTLRAGLRPQYGHRAPRRQTGQHPSLGWPCCDRGLKTRPQESRFHSELGVAYAGLGRHGEAKQGGETALALLPVSEDALAGATSLYHLAQIYAAVGDLDAAATTLEELLAIPSLMSHALLRIEPYWDPLRGHPPFERLVQPK